MTKIKCTSLLNHEEKSESVGPILLIQKLWWGSKCQIFSWVTIANLIRVLNKDVLIKASFING